MWSNYAIMMMRKYKSWSGLALVTLVGLIMVYALLVLLINNYLVDRNTLFLVIIILISMVAGIAYVNFVSLQLSLRLKEFFIRKLLGASDNDIKWQLLLESIVLLVFLVVSGTVMAQLVSPFSENILDDINLVASRAILGQVLVVVVLVLPIALLTAIFPIRTFLNFLSTNFSKLSQH
jgi:putative ABC transport system permease protein